MSQPDTHPDYRFVSQADLPGVSFATLREIILAQAQTEDLAVSEDHDARLTLETPQGLFGLRPSAHTEAAGMVAAKDARGLFVMKSALTEILRQVLPTAAIDWTDRDGVTALPSNLQFMRTIKVEALGPVFLRATLEGEDVSAYGEASIHFRLLQAAPNGVTDWPTVAPNGSIKYFDGPSAPHKPVYTARSVDYRKGQIVTDIFLHDGGKTTEWAAQVQAGDQTRHVVGLVGPMGGGLMRPNRCLMASDETGFPAAARILENLPKEATGELFLEAAHGADCDYPFEVPEGITVTWLSRAKGERLLDAVLERHSDYARDPIWFAGEKDQARQLRETTKAAGYDAENLRISGFWRDESVA